VGFRGVVGSSFPHSGRPIRRIFSCLGRNGDRAHNPKVAGSNPAPATKINHLDTFQFQVVWEMPLFVAILPTF